ncbi:MAG: DinB family protein [Anaerolineales bacterium]|nr:DinB family protein [Anaerolineales bacterium]
MTDNVTREQFIEEVRRTRQAWQAALSQVPEGRLQEAGVCGDWSVKDLIAHIAWYEGEMVGLLSRRELAGSELWNLPLEARNAAIHALSQDRPLPEVLAEARETAAAFLAWLATLSEEELNDPGRFTNMPLEWQPWMVIASNSSEHYQEHLSQLHAWLARGDAAAAQARGDDRG